MRSFYQEILKFSSKETSLSKLFTKKAGMLSALSVIVLLLGLLTFLDRQVQLSGLSSLAAPSTWKVKVILKDGSLQSGAQTGMAQVNSVFKSMKCASGASCSDFLQPISYVVADQLKCDDSPAETSGYNLTIYYMPGCTNRIASLNSRGPNFAFVIGSQAFDVDTTVHEVGHYAFGLDHASMYCAKDGGDQDYSCSFEQSTDKPAVQQKTVTVNGASIPSVWYLPTSAIIRKYGDPYSVMGHAQGTAPYSNMEIQKVGWPMQAINASTGTYTLTTKNFLKAGPYYIESRSSAVIIRKDCIVDAWNGSGSDTAQGYCVVMSLPSGGSYNGDNIWIKNNGANSVYVGIGQNAYPGSNTSGGDDTSAIASAELSINQSSIPSLGLRWECKNFGGTVTAKIDKNNQPFKSFQAGITSGGSFDYLRSSGSYLYNLTCTSGSNTRSKAVTVNYNSSASSDEDPGTNPSTTILQGRKLTSPLPPYSDGPATNPLIFASGDSINIKWVCPQGNRIKIENALGTLIHESLMLSGNINKLLTNSGPGASNRSYYLRCLNSNGTIKSSDGPMYLKVNP